MPSLFSGTEEFTLKLFIVVFLRYFILAAIGYGIYYIVKKKAWNYRKIQLLFPKRGDYWREFIYSFITAVIFTLVGLLVFKTSFIRITQIYFEIEEFGILYLILSIPIMIIIHDAYFYWAHRIMHLQSVFKHAHRTHHLSTNPSPWAAMAFHPIEAVIEAGIVPVLAIVMPVHPLGMAGFLLIMMIYNVYGHLGYELYPPGFAASRIGRWINTSVSHNQHHQFFVGNYGLYFLWWDRWMGTIRTDYDTKFTEVASRKG
ncbi:MAG: sterol desaturase family protein [Flammeovirgaceae bacterium]|nr:sterol desaturase family protein [Flammeovirgaceae bacterium]